MLSITGRTSTLFPNTICGSGNLRTRGSLSLLRLPVPIVPKLRSLVPTGHDELSFAVDRKLSAERAERAGLEVVLGSAGPLYCTFWKGELVSIKSNPVYSLIKEAEESEEESESESGIAMEANSRSRITPMTVYCRCVGWKMHICMRKPDY